MSICHETVYRSTVCFSSHLLSAAPAAHKTPTFESKRNTPNATATTTPNSQQTLYEHVPNITSDLTYIKHPQMSSAHLHGPQTQGSPQMARKPIIYVPQNPPSPSSPNPHSNAMPNAQLSTAQLITVPMSVVKTCGPRTTCRVCHVLRSAST